jgi:hypothetical protein
MHTPYTDVMSSPVVQRGVAIERKSALDRSEFDTKYIGDGGRPVIVTDAVERWTGARHWSCDWFRERYGSDAVLANSPFFLEAAEGLSPVKMQMRLGDYIDYIMNPTQPPIGTYVEGSWEALQANRIPLYAPGYRPFLAHPELRADLDPSPYFTEDLLALLPQHLKNLLDRLGSPVYYLFFAPRGAVVFLHEDYWETHAYLAQLAGRKYCVLFSPDDSDNLYGGEVIDPIRCDVQRFPRFLQATPHVGELRPGEMLFIPSRWKHCVITLEPSLTFSYDFFTRSNMGAYLSNFFLSLARFIARDQNPAALAQARALLQQVLVEAASEQESSQLAESG